MKKVLILNHWGGIGGANVSLMHIVENLNKDKYHITIACPSVPGDMLNYFEKDYDIIALKDRIPIFNHFNGGINRGYSINAIKNYIEIYRSKQKVITLINEVNPDIVIINSMTLCWIGELAKKMGKKTICFHRETYQKGLIGLRSYYIKNCLRRWFDEVIFISNYDLRSTGKCKGNVHVLYDKVDVDKYKSISRDQAIKELGLDKNKKYILYLGGRSKLKGAHVAIKAMKYIKKNDVKLIFIQKDKGYLPRKVKEGKSIKDKIKILFNLDYDNKLSKMLISKKVKNKILIYPVNNNPHIYYKACDVVIFPSTKAHQARPIYEAGASSIPLIITDFKETSEFINDSRLLFKVENAKKLANRIEKVLDNENNWINRVTEEMHKDAEINHNIRTLKDEISCFL